jgi:hypothetical protein
VDIETPLTQEDTMSTLIELNALRVANNMKRLKAWKESKAKLVEAIAKLSGITTAEQQLKASVEVTKVPTGMTAAKIAAAKAKEQVAAKKLNEGMAKLKAKKDAQPKVTKELKDALTFGKKKVAVKEVKTTSDNILATVCDELEINPKVARAKLRREFGKKEDGKWPTTAKAMTDFLNGDKRKKD